eukprot:CAMPEP_0179164212 /NCGR_PEP_ID=MMETSP0796-20121207/80571_1 /TAXON_ID=73915 /ORGANISM="Pyrodinium bahamense, Strain pbaha01" /LENGTH=692 /DNA_ID=CAMNT_0020866631 /DNA_START=179 /DNA_END=2254 /DNA_ORIENTATION=-
MLQMMQQKVMAEGQKEEKLWEKYMCYCESSSEALKKSISAAEAKLPELESSIKELTAETQRLKGDVEQAKADRGDADAALSQSESIQGKEHDSLVKEATETAANIKALDQAIKSLESGLSSSFLQTSAASTLRQLTVSLEMSTADRDLISAFLANDQSEGETPQTAEILGILKQMKEEMEAALQQITGQDNKTINEGGAMTKAKSAQIAALTKQIEEKMARIGENEVEIVSLEGDYDDTLKALEEDRKFLADLQKGCAKKKADWGEHQNLRSQELQALAQAIKILNDDEALNLFKKTLPTPPTFLQVTASSKAKDLRQKALQALTAAQRRGQGQHGARLELLAAALRSRRASFDKVLKMIDEMMALLRKEQTDDDKKRDYCRAEIDETEDQLRELKLDVSDLEKAINENKQKIAGITEEVAALSQAIQQLDKQVAESTAQRKEEHADYVEQLGMNSATKELLMAAKNVLNKFYKPKAQQAKSPPPAEEEAPFFAQLSMRRAGAPDLPPPPEDLGGSYEKSEGSGGVIHLIEMLATDLTKETQELESNERDAQQAYEEAMADASNKHAGDARIIAEKEGVKAEMEARLHKQTQEKKSKSKEVVSVGEYKKDLHSECDWLLENYDVRMDARDGEMQSLQQAKAVLSGADYSLAQHGRPDTTASDERGGTAGTPAAPVAAARAPAGGAARIPGLA